MSRHTPSTHKHTHIHIICAGVRGDAATRPQHAQKLQPTPVRTYHHGRFQREERGSSQVAVAAAGASFPTPLALRWAVGRCLARHTVNSLSLYYYTWISHSASVRIHGGFSQSHTTPARFVISLEIPARSRHLARLLPPPGPRQRAWAPTAAGATPTPTLHRPCSGAHLGFRVSESGLR